MKYTKNQLIENCGLRAYIESLELLLPSSPDALLFEKGVKLCPV